MYQKGFTLYISIVISAAALLGAYAISNTLLNQRIFFTDYEDSQKAFLIADAGVECAQAYDLSLDEQYGDAFKTDTVYPYSLNCGEINIANGNPFQSGVLGNMQIGGVPQSKFEVRIGEGCVVVTVQKSGLDPDQRAVITAMGYNICEPGSARRVERTVRATY